MTHSTCCNAPLIYKGKDNLNVLCFECSKCHKFITDTSQYKETTPPPLLSEIEGEIRGILHKYGCTDFMYEPNDLLNDLTALYTHHTSVQVKEALEKFKKDTMLDKRHHENVYWKCPKCGEYGEAGQFCHNDRRKLVEELIYWENEADQTWNNAIETIKSVQDTYIKELSAQAAEGEGL